MEEPAELFAKLEVMGEDDVRTKLSQRIWSEPRTVSLVRDWLDSKDRARSAASSAKRDAREEETLSIAKEALRIASADLAAAQLSASSSAEAATAARIAASAAQSQARWALWAAIIAVIAAAIATKDQILALIFGIP